MTQTRNTDLTPEEQAEIAENVPVLLEAIAKGSPAAPGWLANWRSNRIVCEEAKEQADTIRQEEVAAALPEQKKLAQWCGFPTDMTRCSPFFPMNSNELGHREFLRDFLITSANWGEIHYTGPQLSTYEEDSLLALLAVLDGQSQYRERCDVIEAINHEGKKEIFVENEGCVPLEMRDIVNPRLSLTYRGPALPLLRLLGYQKPGKDAYRRVISALKLLTVAGIELLISTGQTKSGKRRTPRITQMSAILAGVYWDDKKKELTATINPFFYETYLAGRVTLMDVAKRMQLKGTITKALYRFVQSQRKAAVFTGHFLTLADALNMDREQPAKTTRKRLREAISELIRHGLLTKKSRFVGQDIVNLDRARDALPERNKKCFKSV